MLAVFLQEEPYDNDSVCSTCLFTSWDYGALFLCGDKVELEYSLTVYKQLRKSMLVQMEAEFEGTHNVNQRCQILGLLERATEKGAELVWKIHDHKEEMKPSELFAVLTTVAKHGMKLIA